MPDAINTADAAAKARGDLKVSGNPDAWVLVCKASSDSLGFAKSTKAMQGRDGVVLQVTTEHRNREGVVTACSDAVTFIPGASLTCDGGIYSVSF